MDNTKDAKQLSKVSDLLSGDQYDRDPVQISISIDRSIRDRLNSEKGNMNFSLAVEKILRRALDKGVA
jgi:hypothetical protein